MKLFTAFLILALAGGIVPAAAQTPAAAAISITDAYAFAVPAGTKTGAVFLTLTYPPGTATVPDRLTKIETPAAARAEMHTMSIEDNVMTMRPVESFPLPPTGSFMMKPQGAHIMLMDLTGPLKTGDHFPLVLVFEKAGSVSADVTVRAPGDIPVAEPSEEKAVHQDMMMKMDHAHDMKP